MALSQRNLFVMLMTQVMERRRNSNLQEEEIIALWLSSTSAAVLRFLDALATWMDENPRGRVPRLVLFHSHQVFGLWPTEKIRAIRDEEVLGADYRFKERFRMTPTAFILLRDKLAPHLSGDHEWKAVKVMVALWRLASGDAFRSISLNAGFPTTWVFMWFVEVCNAIKISLRAYISIPPVGSPAREAINKQFSDALLLNRPVNARVLTKWSTIVGAIDGSHVPLKILFDTEATEYRDRNSNLSMNLHAMACYDLRFLHVSIGHAGATHDSGALQLTALWNYEQPHKTPDIIGAGQVILADAAYPCNEYIIPAFKKARGYQNLPNNKKQFNRTLSSLRNCVERAFRLLKARWACLVALYCQSPQQARLVMWSCVYLHNFCLTHSDSEYRELDNILDPQFNIAEPPLEDQIVVEGQENVRRAITTRERKRVRKEMLQDLNPPNN